jgi:hypothetical protein
MDKDEILKENALESAVRRGVTAMPDALNKQQLISLVQEIMQGKGNEQQITEWGDLIDRSTPGPWGYVFDLIFYPHLHGLGNTPTAEEIVEEALSYKPIQLSSWISPLCRCLSFSM